MAHQNEATMPTTNRTTKLLRRTLFATIASATALTAGAQPAYADEVSPSGKGIVGGALLGAEVVTIVESFIGVRQGWAYGLGAGIGAVGGGIGGYFVEQGSTDGRAPVYMLAGGLALIIPAVVLTLNATRYMPDETATQDAGVPADLPPADPGKPGGNAASPGSAAAPATTPATTQPATPSPSPVPPPPNPVTPPQAAPPIPDALFHLNVDIDPKKAGSFRAFRVGVPIPVVKPMWSQNELKQYGVAQGTEMRVSVVKLTF